MVALRTNEPDKRIARVSFAFQFFDAVTERPALVSDLEVALSDPYLRRLFRPVVKPDATFVFCDLPSAAYSIQVQSDSYFPRAIPFTAPAPNPKWPGLPDQTLADPDLRLDDPNQKATYLASRASATLWPNRGYVFDDNATLVRGAIMDAAQKPLEGAIVQRSGDPLDPQNPQWVTDEHGEYTVFFQDRIFIDPRTNRQKLPPVNITISVIHASQTTQSPIITIHRGMTVVQNITVP